MALPAAAQKPCPLLGVQGLGRRLWEEGALCLAFNSPVQEPAVDSECDKVP